MSKFGEIMQSILFEVEEDEAERIIEIFNKDVDKLNASRLAVEKCMNMIADAIAKAEIMVQKNGDFILDENYYRLNIQPNDNETGTDFWQHVAKRLLSKSECVIVPIDGKYYIADSWTTTDSLLRPKRYTDITLESCDVTYRIRKSYSADGILHMRYHNGKIREYLNSFFKQYDKVIDSMNAMTGLVNSPKFKLRVDAPANITVVDSKTGEKITIDQYTERIASQLESEKVTVFRFGQGVDLEQLKIDSKASAKDLVDIIDDCNKAAAKAFSIPITVFDGTVTEKSDADNEFMTYAVDPIVEVINDSLNAKVVGMEDYVKNNERITVFTANHKHRDVVDCAANLEKLRGIGFTLDEIFKMIGYMPLNTEFSTKRLVTKNIGEEEEGGTEK